MSEINNAEVEQEVKTEEVKKKGPKLIKSWVGYCIIGLEVLIIGLAIYFVCASIV